MNVTTHNDDSTLDNSLTCLQGYIDTSYDSLVQRFGQPMPGFDKTDAEWVLKTEDGTLITIYNWKNGPNYNGKYGTPVRQITRWNVGGHSRLAVIALRELMATSIAEAA